MSMNTDRTTGSQLDMTSNTTRIALIGGIIAAIGASLCCVGPLILLLLGVSGTWISTLTAFEPFRPYLMVGVLILFSWAGFQLYRPIEKCEVGSICAIPEARLRYQIIFWVAAVFALTLVTSIYWIPWII